MKTRITAILSGVVQGVGFRAWTHRVAVEHGLVGYAKNLPDGTVQVVCEGEEGIVEAFVEMLHKGPEGSLVRDVAVVKGKNTGEFSGFEIR